MAWWQWHEFGYFASCSNQIFHENKIHTEHLIIELGAHANFHALKTKGHGDEKGIGRINMHMNILYTSTYCTYIIMYKHMHVNMYINMKLYNPSPMGFLSLPLAGGQTSVCVGERKELPHHLTHWSSVQPYSWRSNQVCSTNLRKNMTHCMYFQKKKLLERVFEKYATVVLIF